MNISQVIATDVDGAFRGLKGRSGELLSVCEFMNLVMQADQYDWAFFFMYRSPTTADPVKDEKGAIQSADVTVRLADDTYFFVYTKIDDFAGAG
jgi:hypothetical protein